MQAFSTDGDEALEEAFAHNFQLAAQLWCFLHVKRNILSKLKDHRIPSLVSEEFLSDIFRKHVGYRHVESLVDSTSTEDYCVHLENGEET